MGIPALWRWGGRSQERLLGELGLRVTGRVHGRTQVVYNVGLCICLFDITKLEDAYVFPGDGASHTKGGCPLLLGFRFLGAQFSVGSPGLGLGDLGSSPDCSAGNYLGGMGRIFPFLCLSFPSIKKEVGTSFVVQWLRLGASTAGGTGSIPGWETKIPHAVQHDQ